MNMYNKTDLNLIRLCQSNVYSVHNLFRCRNLIFLMIFFWFYHGHALRNLMNRKDDQPVSISRGYRRHNKCKIFSLSFFFLFLSGRIAYCLQLLGKRIFFVDKSFKNPLFYHLLLMQNYGGLPLTHS